MGDSSNTFMHTIRQQISVSLLRYADILNAEKVFYEAGEAFKVRFHFLLMLKKFFF